MYLKYMSIHASARFYSFICWHYLCIYFTDTCLHRQVVALLEAQASLCIYIYTYITHIHIYIYACMQALVFICICTQNY